MLKYKSIVFSYFNCALQDKFPCKPVQNYKYSDSDVTTVPPSRMLDIFDNWSDFWSLSTSHKLLISLWAVQTWIIHKDHCLLLPFPPRSFLWKRILCIRVWTHTQKTLRIQLINYVINRWSKQNLLLNKLTMATHFQNKLKIIILFYIN